MTPSPNPPRIVTASYGPSPHQSGDLFLPEAMPRAVVCLLHGGFWRMPYDRQELAPLARVLALEGFAVWNMEYRRLGGGGGWPETFMDVAAGIDHLAVLSAGGTALPLHRVVVAGHSAGGHLALWSAARERFPGLAPARVPVMAVAGLAPVADLAAAHALSVGRSAVAEFLGGSPQEAEARYQAASPAALLPLGVRQLVVHGTRDEALPVALSRDYAAAASRAGDDIQFIALPDTGHMDFLDPQSAAIGCFKDWLLHMAALA